MDQTKFLTCTQTPKDGPTRQKYAPNPCRFRYKGSSDGSWKIFGIDGIHYLRSSMLSGYFIDNKREKTSPTFVQKVFSLYYIRIHRLDTKLRHLGILADITLFKKLEVIRTKFGGLFINLRTKQDPWHLIRHLNFILIIINIVCIYTLFLQGPTRDSCNVWNKVR